MRGCQSMLPWINLIICLTGGQRLTQGRTPKVLALICGWKVVATAGENVWALKFSLDFHDLSLQIFVCFFKIVGRRWKNNSVEITWDLRVTVWRYLSNFSFWKVELLCNVIKPVSLSLQHLFKLTDIANVAIVIRRETSLGDCLRVGGAARSQVVFDLLYFLLKTRVECALRKIIFLHVRSWLAESVLPECSVHLAIGWHFTVVLNIVLAAT